VFCVEVIIPDYSSNNDYLAVANVKYRQLKTTESPRIILLGGSSLTFGINQYLLAERTGFPVVNLGVHASFGLPFPAEIIKHYLRQGDIVIAAPEYGLGLDTPDPELIMNSSIDWEFLSRVMWTEYFPFDTLLRYAPANMIKKLHLFFRFGVRGIEERVPASPPADNPYQLAAFDDNGQMTFPRPEPKQFSPDAWAGQIASIGISDGSVSYLNAFNEFVLEKGATLLLSFPPVLDERVVTSSEDIDKAQLEAEERFAFPGISRIREYIFPAALLYDTPDHCNSIGEIRRTELLIDDINTYLNRVK
jgi:hypothetical protein